MEVVETIVEEIRLYFKALSVDFLDLNGTNHFFVTYFNYFEGTVLIDWKTVEGFLLATSY